MLPGEYEFNTTDKEIMEIMSGELGVLLPGETVWKKLAGTGDRFDSFYPALVIGPNGALYSGVYGGLIMMKDTP